MIVLYILLAVIAINVVGRFFDKGNIVYIEVENNSNKELVIDRIFEIGGKWLHSTPEPKKGDVIYPLSVSRYGKRTKSSENEAGFRIFFNDDKGREAGSIMCYNNSGSAHGAGGSINDCKVEDNLKPSNKRNYAAYRISISDN